MAEVPQSPADGPDKRRSRRVKDLPESTLYSRDYLLSPCLEGLDEYLAGTLSVVKQREIELLEVEAGCRVLDLGCGRGETAAEIARRGGVVTAMDYSWDAAVLSRKLLDQNTLVLQSNAVALPFASESFDRVLIADVIEHIPWEMAVTMLTEVKRILTPGGQAFIHTSPNTWFIAVVKRPLVLALRLTKGGTAVERFAQYDRMRAAIHPNELSPWSMRRIMRQAGISARTWVDKDVLRSGASGWTTEWPDWLVKAIGAVAGAVPFRYLLGNDLYAVYRK